MPTTMLENLRAVEWTQIAQPEWNSPGEIPEAVRAFLTIETDSDAERAYDRLLYAVGNNHAGTFYPVAISVAPFLGELLHHETVLIRETVLDVLIDLVGSFQGAPGFEAVLTKAGETLPIKLVLRRAVSEFSHAVEACASNAEEGSREHRLAVELLNELGHD